jgi:hypothetical protein
MSNRMKAHNGSKFERLIHYRNRAEMARILAEDFTQEAVRKTLFDVAANYDALANQAQSEI